jgi:hypothetical protein
LLWRCGRVVSLHLWLWLSLSMLLLLLLYPLPLLPHLLRALVLRLRYALCVQRRVRLRRRGIDPGGGGRRSGERTSRGSGGRREGDLHERLSQVSATTALSQEHVRNSRRRGRAIRRARWTCSATTDADPDCLHMTRSPSMSLAGDASYRPGALIRLRWCGRRRSCTRTRRGCCRDGRSRGRVGTMVRALNGGLGTHGDSGSAMTRRWWLRDGIVAGEVVNGCEKEATRVSDEMQQEQWPQLTHRRNRRA